MSSDLSEIFFKNKDSTHFLNTNKKCNKITYGAHGWYKNSKTLIIVEGMYNNLQYNQCILFCTIRSSEDNVFTTFICIKEKCTITIS